MYNKLIIILALIFLLLFLGYFNFTKKEKSSVKIKSNSMDKMIEKKEVAYFAGGCFWCIEAPLQETDGVYEVVSGYIGGDKKTANYLDVSSGKTKHRESVKVVFNPDKIDYRVLVKTFLYHLNDKQRKIILEELEKLKKAKKFQKEIALKILDFNDTPSFFEAEEYHQDFYKKSSDHYKRYKKDSGREDYINENWAKELALVEIEKERKLKSWEKYKKMNKDELKNELTDLQYKVTQEEGTERAFQNEYWDNKEDGIYVDVISGEPLFSSKDKYDSGTGWPSFVKSIEGIELKEKTDYKLAFPRTELKSSVAESHLGHVFDDGPKDRGGKRYCINSAALKFIPKDKLRGTEYEEYLKLFEE